MSRLLFVVVAVFALWSGDVLACPSCVDPREANTNAFLGSTVALSLIPLAFIFGVVAWVVKHERAANRAAAEEATPPIAPPAE
jgi:hypothetical protein